MFFWILFVLMLAGIIAIPVGILAASINHYSAPNLIVGGMMAIIISLLGVPHSWSQHASDLSKVEAQQHRIQVYEDRIEALQTRLDNASYPDKAGISFDADTPWATMMQSLDNAETELAKAKDERAIAIRSISARKRGPMSGVVTLVGDVDPRFLDH